MSSTPFLSVIIPSYNQGVFLRDTLNSILEQNTEGIEILLLDGGSTDTTQAIIDEYRSKLAFVVSERDGGQTQAINRGMRLAKGEWVCWMNSDDFFLSGCFESLKKHAANCPDIELWYGDKVHVDEDARITTVQRYHPYWTPGVLADKMNLCNQAAFWRRSLFERCGYLDESYQYAMDLEYFIRLDLKAQARARHIYEIWGAQRYHGLTKTSSQVWLDRLAKEQTRLSAEYGLSRSRYVKFRSLMRRFFYHLRSGNPGYLIKKDKDRAILGTAARSLSLNNVS